MTYFEVLIAAFKSLWYLKKAQFAMTFKGEDFAQSEGNIPITTDHEAWLALDPKERDIFNDTKYNQVNPRNPSDDNKYNYINLKELIWDKWSLNEKKFYVELKKQNTINSLGILVDVKTRTQSDEFLERIRNLKISMGYLGTYNTGKYLGWLAILTNILFSPTFARIVTVVTAVAMLFTPLGYGVGAIALTVAIGTVAFDIYRNTAKYRELDNIREENVLLNELKKENAKLQNTLSKTPESFQRIASTMMQNHSIEPSRKSPNFFGAMGYTLFGNYTNMVISTSLSILTLNPVAIMISMLSTVVGYSVATSMHYQFAKRVTYLSNANSVMLAELGPDQNSKSGSRNDILSNQLNMMRCYNLAIDEVVKHPEANKLNPNVEIIRQLLLEAFNYEVSLLSDAKKSPRPSFLEDAWTLTKIGINWADNNRKFTPSFIQADVLTHYSMDTFNANREVRLKVNQQGGDEAQEMCKTEAKDILTPSAIPNPKKPDQPLKSHVEKLTSKENNTLFHNP